MFLEFIVPPERPIFAASQAERCGSSGNFHACGFASGCRRRRSHRLAEFAVHGQLVQHVTQRFGVHLAMFDGDFEQAAMFEVSRHGSFAAGFANRGVQLFA